MNVTTNVWGANTGNTAANVNPKVETKEDKKKAKIANALFSGIADNEDSDSSEDEKKKKKKKKDKKNKEETAQEEGSLIETGPSNSTTAPPA